MPAALLSAYQWGLPADLGNRGCEILPPETYFSPNPVLDSLIILETAQTLEQPLLQLIFSVQWPLLHDVPRILSICTFIFANRHKGKQDFPSLIKIQLSGPDCLIVNHTFIVYFLAVRTPQEPIYPFPAVQSNIGGLLLAWCCWCWCWYHGAEWQVGAELR